MSKKGLLKKDLSSGAKISILAAIAGVGLLACWVGLRSSGASEQDATERQLAGIVIEGSSSGTSDLTSSCAEGDSGTFVARRVQTSSFEPTDARESLSKDLVASGWTSLSEPGAVARMLFESPEGRLLSVWVSDSSPGSTIDLTLTGLSGSCF